MCSPSSPALGSSNVPGAPKSVAHMPSPGTSFFPLLSSCLQGTFNLGYWTLEFFSLPQLPIPDDASLHGWCIFSRTEADSRKSLLFFPSCLSACVIQSTLLPHPSFPWGLVHHLIGVVSVTSLTSMGGMVLVSLVFNFHLFGDLFLSHVATSCTSRVLFLYLSSFRPVPSIHLCSCAYT